MLHTLFKAESSSDSLVFSNPTYQRISAFFFPKAISTAELIWTRLGPSAVSLTDNGTVHTATLNQGFYTFTFNPPLSSDSKGSYATVNYQSTNYIADLGTVSGTTSDTSKTFLVSQNGTNYPFGPSGEIGRASCRE